MNPSLAEQAYEAFCFRTGGAHPPFHRLMDLEQKAWADVVELIKDEAYADGYDEGYDEGVQEGREL